MVLQRLTWRLTLFETLCVIRQHLYSLKNVKSIHRGVIVLVKLQAEFCKFTESNTPAWVFFTFFKLYKWCERIDFDELRQQRKQLKTMGMNEA